MIRYWNRLSWLERGIHLLVILGVASYPLFVWLQTRQPGNGGPLDQPVSSPGVFGWGLIFSIMACFFLMILGAIVIGLREFIDWFRHEYLNEVMSRTPPKHIEANDRLIEMRMNINQLERELGKEITKW